MAMEMTTQTRRGIKVTARLALVLIAAFALAFAIDTTAVTAVTATATAKAADAMNSESCAESGGEGECVAEDIDVTDSRAAKQAYEESVNFEFPPLCVVVLAYEASPFVEHVLDSLYAQSYDKAIVNLNIATLKGYHSHVIEQKIAQWIASNGPAYRSATQTPVFAFKDHLLSNIECMSGNTDHHVLLIDTRAHLTNPFALKHLVMENRAAISPLLSRQGKYWSNFWDDATNFGSDTLTFRQLKDAEAGPQPPTGSFRPSDVTYVRSARYLDIVERKLADVFVVPFVFSAILFHKDAVPYLRHAIAMTSPEAARVEFHFWLSMNFHMNSQGVEMAVVNTVPFGHLVDPTNFNPAKLHPELYLVEQNPFEWSALYLNNEYEQFAKYGDLANCTDVYLVPMFSPMFAAHLIDECEAFGEWSGGDHRDERIQGGYEPVPTQDIHFNQIGFRESWHYILKTFLRPITSFYYMGYTLQGDTTLDFVVRYRPDKQDYLRPHHDASTVTLNVALNRGNGVDYSGGGTRFLRQNCTMLDVAPGWGTLSPGRLTHYHEGLRTTAGTRYILVSFIDQ